MSLRRLLLREIERQQLPFLAEFPVGRFVGGRTIRTATLEDLLRRLNLLLDPPRTADIRSAIRAQMHARGMTAHALAKQVERQVPRRTVYNFLNGGHATRLEVVEALLKAVGVSVVRLHPANG